MMSLGLLFSLFYSTSSSSHTSAFFCVGFIFGQASSTLAPRTESNAYHIHFFPLALSRKTTSVFRTEVTAKVPELSFIGTGWFICSFLNQSPWPGRWVWCSSWARVVGTLSWSWTVEVGLLLHHSDWEWRRVLLPEGAMDAGQVKTMAVHCDIIWSGGCEGPALGWPMFASWCS